MPQISGTARRMISSAFCMQPSKAIREAGLRCPDDIAVVSFDGTTESEYCCPPLTVARQPVQAMAEAAVSAVLNRTSPPAAYQRFATELVIRESCGCSSLGQRLDDDQLGLPHQLDGHR